NINFLFINRKLIPHLIQTINASSVFINESFIYKNGTCIYIIKAFIYRLQTAKRNFSIRGKKLCIGKKGTFLLIANVRDST
ncbi:hypothetical protein, partial [Bacteroides sp.]|uniref:hypothetical protein n=1 Tax=Bacteroides sp. TaxID=29523 RepID=UPI003AB111F2